jgi:hypothetical protein
LLQLADGGERGIRVAAIKSLGSTIALKDLSKLIRLTIASQATDRKQVAQEALRTACARLPREACAEKLSDAMSDASMDAKVYLLEQLAVTGGATALNTMAAAAQSGEDALQDAATRLLGKWPTADAAPVLFELAKTLTNDTYRIRALRGYVRIARQLKMTPEQRTTVCRNTLALAERSEDKMLVLEVLRRFPTPEGLTLAVSLLGDEALQQHACSTIVAMAPGVAGKAPEQTVKALRQVLDVATDQAVKQAAAKQLARKR